jgi:SAM-dependent methyltransferase
MSATWLAIPHTGFIHPGVMHSAMHASRDPVHVAEQAFGCLTHNFNVLWANAYNHATELDLTHFAMLHSDITASPGWIDTLIEEADRVGADVLSVVIAIADGRGLTSTGLRAPGGWYVRRLTMTEIYKLPETFCGDDLGEPDRQLVLNTGCWICRFSKDLWQKFPGFHVQNQLRYYPESDTLEAGFWPEDWEFSSWCHEHGLKIYATRKVSATHHGRVSFANTGAWGNWPYDLDATIIPPTGEQRHLGGATLPTKVTPNGDPRTWCPPVWDYFIHREGIQRVLDVGAGCGFAARYFEQRGLEVWGVEGDQSALACYQGQRAIKHDFHRGPAPIDGDFDLVWSCEVAEHIDQQYERFFLDALAHGKTIAMTHAFPGDDGVHHVNCQHPEYWIKRIEALGYHLDRKTTDQLRGRVNHGSLEGAYFARSGLVFRRLDLIT